MKDIIWKKVQNVHSHNLGNLQNEDLAKNNTKTTTATTIATTTIKMVRNFLVYWTLLVSSFTSQIGSNI